MQLHTASPSIAREIGFRKPEPRIRLYSHQPIEHINLLFSTTSNITSYPGLRPYILEYDNDTTKYQTF